jgi:hypothetical protein
MNFPKITLAGSLNTEKNANKDLIQAQGIFSSPTNLLTPNIEPCRIHFPFVLRIQVVFSNIQRDKKGNKREKSSLLFTSQKSDSLFKAVSGFCCYCDLNTQRYVGRTVVFVIDIQKISDAIIWFSILESRRLKLSILLFVDDALILHFRHFESFLIENYVCVFVGWEELFLAV